MSLDLTKVVPQVGGMVAGLRQEEARRAGARQTALAILQREAARWEDLAGKIDRSQVTWLVPGLVEGLDGHFAPPSLPSDFTVIASDGSHIDVDRHQAARCCLINIGRVRLTYGAHPEARLDSTPHLYYQPEDLVIRPAGKGREQPVEGPLLGIKRGVAECQELARLAKETPAENVLLLLDGSLILWGLEAFPDFVTDELLVRGFLAGLDGVKEAGRGKRLALASYISFPRATEVVNALRVALCPHSTADCDLNCPPGKERACDVLAGVQDQEIFNQLLAPGERSVLFRSRSSVVREHYGLHQVYFFYLRTEDEIARVELPEWAVRDSGLVGLAHGMILDQCRRGGGYPVAISEAHEQAVVREADRQIFWELVGEAMVGERLPQISSAKSRSKRTRWV